MAPTYKIFQDWNANKGNFKARLILTFFRIVRFLRHHGVIIFLLGLPFLILYRVLIEWVLGVEVPWNLRIGKNTQIHHGQALVVHDHSEIGANVILRQSTTIGAKIASDGKIYAPIIGNNVDIGSNVVILGNVRIGDNVIIGAGSVVVKDVPSNSVVAGNPAKLLYSTATSRQ